MREERLGVLVASVLQFWVELVELFFLVVELVFFLVGLVLEVDLDLVWVTFVDLFRWLVRSVVVAAASGRNRPSTSPPPAPAPVASPLHHDCLRSSSRHLDSTEPGRIGRHS